MEDDEKFVLHLIEIGEKFYLFGKVVNIEFQIEDLVPQDFDKVISKAELKYSVFKKGFKEQGHLNAEVDPTIIVSDSDSDDE